MNYTNLRLSHKSLSCSKTSILSKQINVLQQAAKFSISILIGGECGTGKEILAHAIHNCSNQRENNLVIVNCGALPDSLAERELFGCKKGAFTGADRDYAGKIKTAAAGTLFLDEIAELSLDCQAKLLRVLQEKKISPLGSNYEENVDFRLICATNQDLKSLVKINKFREDLYYRIAVLKIKAPALRNRMDDFDLIAQQIWKNIFSNKDFTDLTSPNHSLKKLNKTELKSLKNYNWPGNIRELKNILENYAILKPIGKKITDLMPHDTINSSFNTNKINRNILIESLKEHNFNKSKTALFLNISRGSLDYQIKKFNAM